MRNKASKINITNRVNSGLMLLILFVVFIFAFHTEAHAQINVNSALTPKCMDVRIGLEGLYGKKNIITIYNNSVCLGFSVNNSYKAEVKLSANGGFSFEAIQGDYALGKASYRSFAAAKEICQKINKICKSGAMVCYYDRLDWRVIMETKVYDKYKNEINQACSVDLYEINDSELVKLYFGNSLLILSGNGTNGYPQISLSSKNSNGISLGTRSYRGRIEIGRYGKSGVTAVNIVNAEAYLKGVITSEMSSSWHKEALKAQAVCSRSYLLANSNTGADSNISKPYSLVDTDESQVYKGISGESTAGISAVNSTYGIVIEAEGKILPAYYFSTSGGSTDFSADVWGGNSNHFISVFDEYETNPERAPWCVKTTYKELQSRLSDSGYDIGNINDIFVEIRTDSERVSSVKIKHSKGTTSISGGKLRSILGMHSTKFKIVTLNHNENKVYVLSDNNKEINNVSDMYIMSGSGQLSKISEQTSQLVAISDKNMYNYNVVSPKEVEIWFLGMGWGHGIGMSQSGAYGMALKGFLFDEIIDFYYNDVKLVKLNY